MASDLKMEIFAYKIFHDLWLKEGIINTKMNILQIYGDECLKDSTYTEACDNIFARAIACRFFVFHAKYSEVVDHDYISEMKSLSECFDYLILFCDREDMFGHLTVFEKMFATCTFALFLSYTIYPNGSLDIVNYGHIVWAMYFDKFSNQFYKEGGWNELKRVAKTYDLLFDFFRYFGEERNLRGFKEASINYSKFKNAIKYVKCKKMYKGKSSVSLLWIKFQTEHIEHVPISFGGLASTFDIELLLQDLRLTFNFSSECDFDNVKLLEDKIHEKHISWNHSKSFCNEFTMSINNFQTQPKVQILESSIKVASHEIMNKTENFGYQDNSATVQMLGKKSDGNLGEYSHSGNKCPQFETDIENSTKIDVDIDYGFKNVSFDSESEKGLNDILSTNCERLTEAMNAEDILSTNLKEEHELPKQISPKNIPNPKNFFPKNEIIKGRDERESSCQSLKSNTCSKYEKTCNKDAALTVKEITLTATKSEKNEIPKKMYTQKDFLTINQVIKTSEGKEHNNIELDKLRTEQDDPGICSLLRMILVLGDKQGIQDVRCTLRNNEKNKKKRKIKSKNKK